MKPHQSALLVLLATATLATPCAAQQAPASSRALPVETCAGCFAYLVFSPPLEPEPYAMSAQATDATTSTSVAGEPNDRIREQSAGLFVTSKQ